jgi:hypothetical protein
VHDEGFGRALVLEDDGVLHPKANLSLLLQAMREVPGDAEIAYLGHCFSRTHFLVTPLWRHGAASCTHAYVIWHFCAARLLQLLLPLSARSTRSCATCATVGRSTAMSSSTWEAITGIQNTSSTVSASEC